MKLLPSFVRQGLISAGRNYFAPQAAARRGDWPSDKSGISVHMVVGHAMLPMGLLALRSWEFHTGRRWHPFIHEDGSFTAADRETLLRHFPDAVIIDRAKADREVTEALAGFPACRRHRANHNWFLKVFDTRHYAPGERYLIIDSDIVFFRRPSAVLDWIDGESEEMWIMEDEKEKYSHPRGEIEASMNLRMLERANSGLDLMPKSAANLALADRL